MEKVGPWGKIVILDILPSENKTLSDSQLSLAIGHELKLRPARFIPGFTLEHPKNVRCFALLHFAHYF